MKNRNFRQQTCRRLSLSALTLAIVSVTACGGSNINTSATNPDGSSVDNGDGSVPVLADPKLETVAADSVIRDSMIDFYTDTGNSIYTRFAIEDTQVLALESTADSADGGSAGSAPTQFSGTNVQEAGVDESDRVKLDGNVMFALERPDFNYYGGPAIQVGEPEALSIDRIPQQPVDTLTAYRLDKENSQRLSRLTLDSAPSGMYLHKNGGNRELLLLSGGGFDWGYWSSPYGFYNAQTTVSWINASDENDLSVGRTLTVDGSMVSSRKIGNQLILVTRFDPYIEGIVQPYNEEVVAANKNLIEAAPIEDLMPGYSLQVGGTSSNGKVIRDNQCYRAAKLSDDTQGTTTDANVLYTSPTVISIITVDLNDQSTAIKSSCFIGQSETMYVSQNALYLATTRYEYNISNDSENRPFVEYYPPEISTDIHKFGFRNGQAPDFRGSAAVSGHLGWFEARKPFRMSEKDGRLRVVTFDDNRAGSPVTLNILEEGAGDKLTIMSTLPNDSRPAPIGKPNENLYASRFIGDRAYLVTFRITDPLYVLDLSDPYDPYIAGELELPGYSDYLHPASENLLVGVGKDAIAADGTGWGDGRGAFYQGVKLALFDVTDPSNPFVADDRVIGKRGTDSPALYNHHSFAWLPGDGNRLARMAIPLSLHNGQSWGTGPSAGAAWTENKMLKMEVDVANARFVNDGSPDWLFESNANGQSYSPISLHNDRARIASDGGLYVIHNGKLHYGLWNNSAPSSATE